MHDSEILKGKKIEQYYKRVIEESDIIIANLKYVHILEEKEYKLKGIIKCLIIDEACQIVEPKCIAPFSLQPDHIILAGDHKQLAAHI